MDWMTLNTKIEILLNILGDFVLQHTF